MDNRALSKQGLLQLSTREYCTNGQLINAFASVAARLDSTAEDIVRKTNLDIRTLIQQPSAVYHGIPAEEIKGLTASERILLDYELRQELSRRSHWLGIVDGGGGATLHIAPAAEAKMIAVLPERTSVEVVSYATLQWLYIRTAKGSGYVLRDRISPLPQKVTATTQSYNRSGAADQKSAAKDGLRAHDPKLYDALQDNIQRGLQKNNKLLNTVRGEATALYRKILWIYRVLFLLGISASAASILLAYMFRNSPAMLIASTVFMGGIAFVAFLIFFATRPLDTLQKYRGQISWLNSVDATEVSHKPDESKIPLG